MKDVARLAKVSTSTVSHVINNNRFVSEAVRTKVLDAVAQLNYAPSALARSLKLKETRTLGMLLTTSNNPFFAEVVRDVERICYQRGYSLIVCNTEGNLERMNSSLETLLQKRVDGLLMMCTESSPRQELLFERYPAVPIVMMDWAPYRGVCDIIQDNSLEGGRLATEYLLAQGYRDIACIVGPSNNTQAQQRLEGYKLALRAAGVAIRDELVIFSDFQFNGGLTSMERLLALTKPPTAVFTGNDAMAVGVYLAVHQAGLAVGKDIAVVGYDNIELAGYLCPPLTTIQQPKDKLGESAVDLLLNRIAHPEMESQVLALKPELVVRQSSPVCRR
jgi:LacI family transcriptional regulator